MSSTLEMQVHMLKHYCNSIYSDAVLIFIDMLDISSFTKDISDPLQIKI